METFHRDSFHRLLHFAQHLAEYRRPPYNPLFFIHSSRLSRNGIAVAATKDYGCISFVATALHEQFPE